MNLFRSEEHARRWPQFNPASEVGFISLPELAGFFGTETRRHMLDADYLSAWLGARRSGASTSRAHRQGDSLLAQDAGRLNGDA
jgi:hypothetical protein